MSFDWSEYFNLAQELAGKVTNPSTQEAKLRSAISRSYYAIYCLARNYLCLRERHSIPGGREAKDFVHMQFRIGSKERKKIGSNLDRLRTYREEADYEDIVARLTDNAETSLKLAERAIANLRRL